MCGGFGASAHLLGLSGLGRRGLFRIRWVHSLARINQLFVYRGNVCRANGVPATCAVDACCPVAHVTRSSRSLSRRHASELEIGWAGSGQCAIARTGPVTVRLSGQPGDLLLYLLGRQEAATIALNGDPGAVAAVRRTHFGM